jgi:hypothetical protein
VRARLVMSRPSPLDAPAKGRFTLPFSAGPEPNTDSGGGANAAALALSAWLPGRLPFCFARSASEPAALPSASGAGSAGAAAAAACAAEPKTKLPAAAVPPNAGAGALAGALLAGA